MNVFKLFKEFPVESSECNNICIWKIFSCCRSANGQPPAHQAPAWFQACNGRFVPILVGGLKHFLCFQIYWEFHHPNWRTHIFQRGRSTTNQNLSWTNPLLSEIWPTIMGIDSWISLSWFSSFARMFYPDLCVCVCLTPPKQIIYSV